MFEGRIAADRLTLAVEQGFPRAIDALAGSNLAGHTFLRAAWYRGSGEHAGRTLVIRRGDSPDSRVIAAIPTIAFGPAIAGARRVAGAYWPFRAPLLAPDCTAIELAQAFADPAVRALGPVWRIGPARADDIAITTLVAGAQAAGWRVLSRPAGVSWVIDCDAARENGWPHRSTRKRLGRIERRLDQLGTISWLTVRGADWTEQVMEELGAVEASSWIATTTDGSGAKFMTTAQRAHWQGVLDDPVMACMLIAKILRIDGRAVAYCFDLIDGPVQYGIAGSYVTAFGDYDVGKLANYAALIDAIAEGRSIMDMGCGDSGYKREMGAVAGYDLVDLLLVRSRLAAPLLERMWGSAFPPAAPTPAPAHPERVPGAHE